MTEPFDRLKAALADRYAIEREIGAGGMATVYLARDLRHDRRVALKVLRPELAALVGADRFLKEIRTTANLQHPHILPLFDSGEAGGFLFYVMPFLEGESLREKLDREGQLPIDEAGRIGELVANALQYAHEQGVIHRDIKPGNILIGRGEPFVGDFGIALAVSSAGGGRLTETGLSLGTPHYMSPEQAAGDARVDARTDVYALGCVMYEMLVGEPPYTGPSAQVVLAKILTETPRAPAAARASIPANVDAAIQKAIAKLPADRFGSAFELARALSDSSYRAGPAQARKNPRTPALAAAGVAGLGLTLGLALGVGIDRAVARPTTSVVPATFTLSLPDDQRYGGTGGNGLAWTPDGSQLVYAASPADGLRQLWLRPMNEITAKPIAGTEGGGGPAVSPDGLTVSFRTSDGAAIKTVPIAGGSATVVSAAGDLGAATWGPDGMLYFRQVDHLARIGPSGGDAEILTAPASGTDHRLPEVLPDKDGIVFSVHRGGAASDNQIAVVPYDGGAFRVLFTGVAARYARSGHLVWVTADGTLMAARFDPKRLEVTGPSVALLSGLQVDAQNGAQFAISRNGALIYATGSTDHQPVIVTREGVAKPVEANWSGSMVGVALSPDGRRLAVGITNAGRRDVWVKRLDSASALSRVTFDGDENASPKWSADGTSLLFLSVRDGQRQLWKTSVDGTGAPQRLIDFDSDVWQAVWGPGGSVVYEIGRPTSDLVAIRPGSQESPRTIVETPVDEKDPAVSPDGRWIAYASNENNVYEISVRPFANPEGGRWQVSNGGGIAPLWARDGKELFYWTNDKIASVQVSASDKFVAGTPKTLFSTVGYALGDYDITPDGQHFLMNRSVRSSSQLVVIQNFFDILNARVPK